MFIEEYNLMVNPISMLGTKQVLTIYLVKQKRLKISSLTLIISYYVQISFEASTISNLSNIEHTQFCIQLNVEELKQKIHCFSYDLLFFYLVFYFSLKYVIILSN